MTKNPFKKTLENDAPIWYITNYGLLAVIAICCIVPLMNVLSMAFSTYGAGTVTFFPRGLTFYNLISVIKNIAFYRAFGMSVLVTGVGTLLSVSFMFMAAYPLSKKTLPFRQGFMMFFMIVMLFSGGIVPNYFVMSMLGLLNTPFALIFPGVVQVYNMILLKNYLEGVPGEIEESARIDGANNVVILVQILLPICLPSIASVALFTAVTYWNNYFYALIYLTTAEEFYPLAMYILESINKEPDKLLAGTKAFDQKEFIDSAMIVLNILPILCVYPFVLKFFVSGLTVGSVKG